MRACQAVDKAAFDQIQTLCAVKLPGDGAYRLRQLEGVLPVCLAVRRDQGLNNVVTEKHGACERGFSLLLLAPNMTPGTLPQEVHEAVQSLNGSFTAYQLHWGYENFNYKEVLSRLLPADVAVPMGHEIVGHVAHFNLLPEHWPHRHLIGQANAS